MSGPHVNSLLRIIRNRWVDAVSTYQEINQLAEVCLLTSIKKQLHRCWLAFAALIGTILIGAPGLAADGRDAEADGIPSPSIATSLPANGDPLGLRKWLAQHGITYGLTYTGEALGNLSGGVRRGGLYEGKLEGLVAVDLEKLAGARGLSFFVNAFQIHNTSGLRDGHFESLITISNIEAVASSRLSELWLEQKLFNDRFGIRFGQLAADTEFFISDYSGLFISSDWPTITGANLPSGGPAYPLSTPGVRLRFDPDPHWTALIAVFNGDPGNQATVNRTGTRFPVNDPPLLMGELQYRYNQEKDARGLAGTLRLGGWYHFGMFEDLQVRPHRTLAGPSAQQRQRPGCFAAPAASTASSISRSTGLKAVTPKAASACSAGSAQRLPTATWSTSFWTAELSSQACCPADRTTNSAPRSFTRTCRIGRPLSISTPSPSPASTSRCATTN